MVWSAPMASLAKKRSMLSSAPGEAPTPMISGDLI